MTNNIFFFLVYGCGAFPWPRVWSGRCDQLGERPDGRHCGLRIRGHREAVHRLPLREGGRPHLYEKIFDFYKEKTA